MLGQRDDLASSFVIREMVEIPQDQERASLDPDPANYKHSPGGAAVLVVTTDLFPANRLYYTRTGILPSQVWGENTNLISCHWSNSSHIPIIAINLLILTQIQH